jgi:hypothetical protein
MTDRIQEGTMILLGDFLILSDMLTLVFPDSAWSWAGSESTGCAVALT